MYFDALEIVAASGGLSGTLAIIGPASAKANTTNTYTADTSGVVGSGYTYAWSASYGTIVSGQGTSSISFRFPSSGTPSGTITLTITKTGSSLTATKSVSWSAGSGG